MRTSSQTVSEIINEISISVEDVVNWQAYNIANLKNIRSFVGSHNGWLFTVVEHFNEDEGAPRYSGTCRNSRKRIFMHMPIDVAEFAAEQALLFAGNN